VAQAILRFLGVALDGGDPETELKRIEADPLFKWVCEHRENRSSGWLGYVGYTCGQTVKTGSVDEVENAAAILQMKIDAARRSSARPIP
jgi:hypothetical protein